MASRRIVTAEATRVNTLSPPSDLLVTLQTLVDSSPLSARIHWEITR